VRAGLAETSIGVIAPYRAQLALLGERLAAWPGIEVQTVDKFQGRQKACILMSCVRSNPKGLVRTHTQPPPLLQCSAGQGDSSGGGWARHLGG
jgi:superfamily I DNA and/or RNA helicase